MKKKILIGVIVVLIFTFIKISLFNNVDFLCFLSQATNTNTSSLYYFTIESIYKIAEKKDIAEKLIKYIEENKNQNLHGLYIRVLGVIGGGDQTVNCLMKTYIKHQHNKEKKSIIYSVISSLGLLGDDKVIPFLELLLNKNYWPVYNGTIAASLYLLTGKQYEFIWCWDGSRQKLQLTDKLIHAREVILATKGKKRTFEDMLALDKRFRPPAKKYK